MDLDLDHPEIIAPALDAALRAWAVRRGGRVGDLPPETGAEVAAAVCEDLTGRVKPEGIRDSGPGRRGVLADLSPWLLAMEVCDLVLVDAYGGSAYYFVRPEDDPVRAEADKIAADAFAILAAGGPEPVVNPRGTA